MSAWGVSAQGVPAYGGSALRVFAYGSLPRGDVWGVSAWGCTPPPCGQTDACENITFPQLDILSTVADGKYLNCP